MWSGKLNENAAPFGLSYVLRNVIYAMCCYNIILWRQGYVAITDFKYHDGNIGERKNKNLFKKKTILFGSVTTKRINVT